MHIVDLNVERRGGVEMMFWILISNQRIHFGNWLDLMGLRPIAQEVNFTSSK